MTRGWQTRRAARETVVPGEDLMTSTQVTSCVRCRRTEGLTAYGKCPEAGRWRSERRRSARRGKKGPRNGDRDARGLGGGGASSSRPPSDLRILYRDKGSSYGRRSSTPPRGRDDPGPPPPSVDLESNVTLAEAGGITPRQVHVVADRIPTRRPAGAAPSYSSLGRRSVHFGPADSISFAAAWRPEVVERRAPQRHPSSLV